MNIDFERAAKPIRMALYDTIRTRRSVISHSLKVGAACDELQKFYDAFERLKIDGSEIEFTERDADAYQRFSESILKLYALFNQLLVKNKESNLCNQEPDYVLKQILNFKQNINEAFEKTNLKIPPPFKIKENVEMQYDYDDCQKLLTTLQSFPDSYIQEIYLPKLQNYVSKLEANIVTKTDKYLTSADIKSEIDQYSNIFVKVSDYEVTTQIGSNNIVTTFYGIQKTTKRLVLIQKLNFDQKIGQSVFRRFKEQIEILVKTKHFAICNLIGITNVEPYYIITDYYNKNEALYNFIHTKTSILTPTNCTIICLGIAYAMSYLHSLGIIYRNLKSTNVSLDSDYNPHIVNFATSRFSDNTSRLTPKIGTLPWMAPEVYNTDAYTTKADVYSFGMLLYEFLTGEIPYSDKTEIQIITKVFGQKYRPHIPKNGNLDLRAFAKRCWDDDPSKRPTFPEIVKKFETGELAFDGTNTQIIRQYVNKYGNDPRVRLGNFNIDDISSESLRMIVNILMSADPMKDEDIVLSCFRFLIDIITDKRWLNYAVENRIPQVIALQMRDCVNPKFTEVFLRAAFLVLKDPIFQESCKRETFLDGLMNIYSQFGCNSLSFFLDICFLALKNDERVTLVTEKFFVKFAQNICLSDQSIAFSVFKFIKILYDNKYQLTTAMLQNFIQLIFNSLIQNTRDEEQINQILSYIDKLLNNAEYKQSMIMIDAKSTILDLAMRKSRSNLEIKILGKLSEDQRCTEAFASSFAKSFPRLASFSDTKTKSILLYVFTTITTHRIVFKIIASSQETINTINYILTDTDENVLLMALKLCYILINNENTAKSMGPLFPQLVKLLDLSDEIAISCSYCLSSLLINKSVNDPSLVEIVDFISNTCDNTKLDILQATLKLCGAICMTYKGAHKVAKNHKIMEELVSLLKSEEKQIQSIIVNVLLTITAFVPFTSEMKNCIYVLLYMTGEQQIVVLCSSVIANMAASPEGAVMLAPFLTQIADRVTVGNDAGNAIVLAAIERIVSAPETHPIIKNSGNVKWMRKMLQFTNGPMAKSAFSIFYFLCNIQGIKFDIKLEEVDSHINALLANPELSKSMYYRLVRLKKFLNIDTEKL